MKTEAYKLYSRVFWIFLPNFIKIAPCSFELYRFKVKRFFWDTVYKQWQWQANNCHAGQHRQQDITNKPIETKHNRQVSTGRKLLHNRVLGIPQ